MTDLQNAYTWWRQNRTANATQCLAYARKDMVAGNRRFPRTGPVYSGQWQALDTMPRHASPDSRAYYVDAWPEGWRDLGDATNHLRRTHTGWYEDSFQDSLCRGRVLQLPARHGVTVYVPGIYSTGSDGVTLYPLDRYETAEACASMADSYAERAAEIARDYADAWQAGTRAADYADEADALRADIVALTSDLRTARRAMKGYGGGVPMVMERLCEIARKRVAELLASMATLRQKRDDLRDRWSHLEGFTEGYGR